MARASRQSHFLILSSRQNMPSAVKASLYPPASNAPWRGIRAGDGSPRWGDHTCPVRAMPAAAAGHRPSSPQVPIPRLPHSHSLPPPKIHVMPSEAEASLRHAERSRGIFASSRLRMFHGERSSNRGTAAASRMDQSLYAMVKCLSGARSIRHLP